MSAIPYDARIAQHATELYRQCQLVTADALGYATALEYGADLLTCDVHFENLPGVRKG